jgi:hypothetical protein
MFSKGQLIFAILFVIAFVFAMIIAYKRDKVMHNQFYKGNYKILIGFIAFVILLFLIKVLTRL